MEKLKFQAGDFESEPGKFAQALAYKAQAKFDEWYRENIEDAPVVRGEGIIMVGFSKLPAPNTKWEGKLVGIKEIK